MNKTQSWEIEYWHSGSDHNTVETWLDSLTAKEFKSIAKEISLLGLCGNTLRLPHSRSLQKGLFELRERKYGFRIYYTFLQGKVIVLLSSGDKNTQEKDIIIARERLNQLSYNQQELFYENKKLSSVS